MNNDMRKLNKLETGECQLDIKIKYFTENDSINNGRKNDLSGIMIHSTATPGVMAEAWYGRWNVSGIAKSVHAFVDDESIWQYMPWDARAAHAGSGAKGSANDTHIAIEICEPAGFSYGSGGDMIGYDVIKSEPYFRAAFKNAVYLCTYLCRNFGLTENNIISHDEGNKMQIASGHIDVSHWFPKHGENMDSFRSAVRHELKSSEPDPGKSDVPGEGGFKGILKLFQYMVDFLKKIFS